MVQYEFYGKIDPRGYLLVPINIRKMGKLDGSCLVVQVEKKEEWEARKGAKHE